MKVFFLGLLEQAKNQGAEVLVTGDLDMPAHGCWHEKITKKGRIKARHAFMGDGSSRSCR